MANSPERHDLWVQLGNMLKDSGAYSQAETAYIEALRLQPDDFDCWLQRGRALRLAGQRAEALRSFTAVLRRRPGHADAVRELIELGDGWEAGQIDAVGPRLLLDVLDTAARIREFVDRVERELPSIRALTTAPLDHYDSIRRLIPVGQPTTVAGEFGLAILMRGSGPLDLMLRVLHSLREQTHPSLQVAMPDLVGETALAFSRLVSARPDRFCHLDPGPTDALLSAFTSQPGLAYFASPVILDREAASWIAATLSRPEVAVVVCDEDTVRFVNDRPRYSDPFPRGAPDPEMWEQGIDGGTFLGVRSSLVTQLVRESGGKPFQPASLAFRLSRHGEIETIRRPIVSRLFEGQSAECRKRHPIAPPQSSPGVIAVVIPTRDRLGLLRNSLAAVRATARDVSRLRLVVVDNGSKDLAVLNYLAQEAKEGRIVTLRVDEAFNWSRLNRLGADAAPDAEFLVFMNDDVNLTAACWDDRVASLLSRPEVGVIGALLLYPDGTIQHAGVVATPDGRTKHDGRHEPGTSVGPGGRYTIRRSVTAVTGAFLATRRNSFEELGGFDDEALPLWFNDIDYCLKAAAAGLRILYEPAITATHHEGATLRRAHIDPDRDALFADALRTMCARWGCELTNERWSPITTMFR